MLNSTHLKTAFTNLLYTHHSEIMIDISAYGHALSTWCLNMNSRTHSQLLTHNVKMMPRFSRERRTLVMSISGTYKKDMWYSLFIFMSFSVEYNNSIE